MIIILLFCLCLFSGNYTVNARVPRIISKDEDFDLEIINKPPLKTIHTKFGYIDCVDINKQSAFDHPLLKNHQLQLKPSSEDRIANGAKGSTRISNIGIDEYLCSKGSVPIHRTSKEDLIRSKRLSNFTTILTHDFPGQHFAEVVLHNGSYYGISASMSAYNPTVEQGQMSAAYVWVANGVGDDVNCIFAGWQVFPELYGDGRTYFFASWLDKKTGGGCINLQCPGFVQVDNTIPVGSPFSNTSTYDGPQFDIDIFIFQDPTTKNWWIQAQNISIGYFPASLFSNLNSADHGGWTGRTMTAPVGSASPPMGSGHLPDDNPIHSGYFRQMAFRDQSGKDFCPETFNVATNADIPACYDVKYYGFVRESSLECIALFGGPGGNCGY